MSTDTRNIPDFLDRVTHARKDGIVIAFDESEALIHYDDLSQEWVRFERIRLIKKKESWIYMLDGKTLIPFARGMIGDE
jgi:hypothetical protein